MSQGSRSTFKYPFPVHQTVNVQQMRDLVQRHWLGNRSAVSDDTDILVRALQEVLEAQVVEARSGDEVLTWRVPKHWRVRKGQLRTRNGKVLADFAQNPLYLWTHSIAFHGEIDRDELLAEHVYTDQDRPDEIPYHYRNGYRYDAEQWGFSLPYSVVRKLKDAKYVVEIDADLDNEGTLKVVDAFLPGQCEETIFFMAHTCHPGLVGDGLANIAVAVELYNQLKSLPERRFSYRFLFGPEYFAAAVYLARASKQVIGQLHGGFYLAMLSSHEPIGFQRSLQGNTRLDAIVRNVMVSHAPAHVEQPYRRLWGNDEMFFNGPSLLIPTLGIGRAMHREYHYDTDNLENMNVYHMVEAAWILRRIVEVLETDFVPVRKYVGPLCLSRYGLYVDPAVDRLAAGNLEKAQILMDGRRSCMDICAALGQDFFRFRDFVQAMVACGVVSVEQRLPRPQDCGTVDSLNGSAATE